MVVYLVGSLLLLLGLGALGLQRIYSSVPAHELKRLAIRGDELASTLYRAVAYGPGLRLLLWIVIVSSLSAGLLLVVPHVPLVIGAVIVLAVLTASLVWLPALRFTLFAARTAGAVSPAMAWVLSHTHPVLDLLVRTIYRFRIPEEHSRLYEKEDLLALLDKQKEQTDSRILPAELRLAQRTLAFGSKHAADILTPRAEAFLVQADDTIGPILLDQLHKQRQETFLVYKKDKNIVVGSLAMHDAVSAKHGGKVAGIMRHEVMYVHEDFDLYQVMAAFQKTGQHIALVINAFEEYVGVITLSSVLHELLGIDGQEIATDLPLESRSVVAAYKSPAPSIAEISEDVPAVEAPLQDSSV